MRTATEKENVNRLLQQNGLGKLDDPGLVPQLGFLFGNVIRSHEHLRDALNRCEPAERLNMLNALRSYLRFEPKPLDVYVAEMGDLAERRQLPTVGEDGRLYPFQVQDIGAKPKDPELKLANDAIRAEAAKKHLHIECVRCTKEAQYHGWNKDAAVTAARADGWTLSEDGREICPKCSHP